MSKSKNIGIDVKPPKEKCDDKNCPFHGALNVRGRIVKGFIISKDLHKSATLRIEWVQKVRKYERFLKKTSTIRAHNPPCINAEIGDEVRAMECRPLSKTKNYVIIEKIGHDIFIEQKIKEEEEESSKEKGEGKPDTGIDRDRKGGKKTIESEEDKQE